MCRLGKDRPMGPERMESSVFLGLLDMGKTCLVNSRPVSLRALC